MATKTVGTAVKRSAKLRPGRDERQRREHLFSKCDLGSQTRNPADKIWGAGQNSGTATSQSS